MVSDRKPLSSINVTPLVDVLLILLVVLMLAMPMFVKKLPVELPQTSISGAPTVAKSLSVSLRADGSLMLDDSPATIALVLARIDPSISVELNIDQSVKYEAIANLISAVQQKGPREISLMTR
ncbi:Biopolymer transport protein ExbD [compost metagenome]